MVRTFPVAGRMLPDDDARGSFWRSASRAAGGRDFGVELARGGEAQDEAFDTRASMFGRA